MTKESNLPREQPQAVVLRRNLEKLRLELSNINQGIQSYIMGQRIDGTWGAPRYGIGEEVDNKIEGDGPDSDGDEDEDVQSLLQCPSCDFEIEFSSVRRLEEMYYFGPKNMLCPVCDEKLGEDAIKVAQHSSSQKKTWKSDISSVSSGDSVLFEKKLPASGSKHEPLSDPLLSPFIHNVPLPNSSGIHPGEGSSSNASDISNAKGYDPSFHLSSGTDAPADSDNEEDNEEKRLRASFVQEL
ncbi:hypothetical protein CR513_28991, partial [Mucuna pruriens]